MNSIDALARLRGQTRTWKAHVEAANNERAELNKLIVEAKLAGASFSQIREVTGMGVQTIQTILLKAGEL